MAPDESPGKPLPLSLVPETTVNGGDGPAVLNELSDRDLVRRCRQGDTRSFQQLYRRHHTKVRSTLYQLCGPEKLDDLVQDAFLRAWKGLPKFREAAQFSTWLYRIVWNVASDCRRDLARDRSRLQAIAPEADTYSRDGWNELHYRDLVQQGLACLSFDRRTVLVLCDLEDLPQKDVARSLDIPLGTVKSRLFQARAEMRQFLEQQGVQL